ncbi:HAH_0734 family protein [Halomontanus rarus]|uniref:HAH_0734 family protein n=1 Tax=Halomontanus rarus TaxID=3034020 RepID=UPI001A997BD8|nr:HAH_0734 family protein [Halovivax sp. TS33]
MKRLIIHGDPGIRKDAVIEYDGEELTCFGINRNGEWHGPERVQLWCTVGDESEREDYQKRNYVPHFMEVERADAEEIEVLSEKGKLEV